MTDRSERQDGAKPNLLFGPHPVRTRLQIAAVAAALWGVVCGVYYARLPATPQSGGLVDGLLSTILMALLFVVVWMLFFRVLAPMVWRPLVARALQSSVYGKSASKVYGWLIWRWALARTPEELNSPPSDWLLTKRA